MRDFEFRAWDVKRECYIDVSRLCLESKREGWAWIHDGSMYIGKAILEQYTGKDATVENKPIFEGDILQDPIHDRQGNYLFVYWDEEYASFRAKNKSVNYGLLGLHNTEIVGNIHENEGLL